jgi:PAS domain S-box-containing protein
MEQRIEEIWPESTDALLQSLRVHQIELETQNEELRRTQVELDQTRARYFDLYDRAPVGYLTLSETETILETNLTAATLLGVQPATLVGSPIQDFVFPADQDVYFRHRRALAETGQPQTCELRMKQNDKPPFWAQLMATRAHTATGEVVHRLVLTNIEERKVTQDRLRISDSALKAITQGMLIVTPKLIVVEANPAFLAMTGYNEAEVVGQKCTIFNGPRTGNSTLRRFVDAITRERKFSGETFNYRKDGTGFWNELSVSPVYDAQGKLSHFISINTDISARKSMDQALQRKNEELQAATIVAEKANSAKSEFLSNMSHDLRSPLNAIVGFAQLLDTGSPAPTALQKRNIDRILAGGWYLLKLINEILDLAQIESGKQALTLQATPLAPLMLECKNLTESKAQASDIRLQFPALSAPVSVVADPIRLKQVMVNLLSNAIKYNLPGGGVRVEVMPQGNGEIRITVQDTGPGLSADKLAQLFTPFNRLGQENGPTEGTGIGLVVTKKLTELMGGVIGVDSTPSVGSSFWVQFKEAPSTGAPGITASMEPTQERPLAPPPAAPGTVLYIEDSPANIDLVTQILKRRSNLQLHIAHDGPQGIAMARKYQPQVILMDIHLPGMSGLEALRILRHGAGTKHIPVVAVSANAMPLDIVSGLADGFFRYLTKPFQIDEFWNVLNLAMALSIHTAPDCPRENSRANVRS